MDREHQGLTSEEAAARLKEDGDNQLSSAQIRNWTVILLEVLHEPMFLLLLAASSLYFVMGDPKEGLLMVGFVLIIMGVTIVQERRTEKVLENLRQLASPRAVVVRNGVQQRIAGAEVVRDDLLVLSEGDRIPADALVVEAHELAVDESLLTGESGWVPKLESGVPIFAGTLVVRGQGLARVIATGAHTQFGEIGESLSEIRLEASPLRRQIETLTVQLAWVGAALSVVLLCVSVWRTDSWVAGGLTGITLAMAILPQEFPVIMIVFFALGARRLARSGMLTRRLNAIETLGKTTVLCVDKTGTLTENRMTLAALHANGKTQKIDALNGQSLDEHFHSLLEYAILSCEQDPQDPMELALHWFCAEHPEVTDHLHPAWALVREYELSPELMAMTHLWREPGAKQDVVAAKGAPEAIADLCHLQGSDMESLNAAADMLAQQGMRVLGVARARHPVWEPWPNLQHDFDYEFVGLVGLIDPVRLDVPQAIAECHQAGIRVVMVTGDHPVTAQAIAAQVGIAASDVYARVTPQQKLEIIESFKSSGDVVAMTGDGVNDAPALKAAHIGIAMGQRGTDVAREAAALVLMNDSFCTIVASVRSGRLITQNLQQALKYTLTIHMPVIVLSMLPVLLGLPLLLLPVHIAFLELVFNPTCSLVFEAEPASKDLMHRPPVPQDQALIAMSDVFRSLCLGFGLGGLLMILDVWLLAQGMSASDVRALIFTAMVSLNMGLVIHYRRARLMKGFSRISWWIFGLTLLSLGLVIFVPALATLFVFQAPPITTWVAMVFLCLLLFPVYRIIRR